MNVEAAADLLPDGSMAVGLIRVLMYLDDEGESRMSYDVSEDIDYAAIVGTLEMVKAHFLSEWLEEDGDS